MSDLYVKVDFTYGILLVNSDGMFLRPHVDLYKLTRALFTHPVDMMHHSFIWGFVSGHMVDVSPTVSLLLTPS